MYKTDEQRRPKTFWDKIARKYARRPVADLVAYEAKLARVRALLHAGDRVLEIGCGTGSTALTLAPAVVEIVATDLSEEMIEIAEEKRIAEGVSNVRFIRADAAERMAERPFDLIAAFSLLHLVHDAPSVIRSVHDQLKPGGLFLSKTVCLGDANAMLRLFVRALRLVGVAPHVTFLRKEDLNRALVHAGFQILESRYFGKGRLNPFIVAQRPN